ncbi:3D domain-containing protein [Paenibacillus sp. CFBP 13594]|uniref:3D domain-containing protein n=1 Tax=Paenibacillus sp. CFBP 13594 TaxID=2774037 RepID=UPI001FCF992A|nr:3D domain-containing protein [Paenibacillus sp. CFBP 13594]
MKKQFSIQKKHIRGLLVSCAMFAGMMINLNQADAYTFEEESTVLHVESQSSGSEVLINETSNKSDQKFPEQVSHQYSDEAQLTTMVYMALLWSPQPMVIPRRELPEKQVADPSMLVLAPRSEQILGTQKVTATGYTAGVESTGKGPKHPQYGITYSGVKVRRDKETVSTIAADPKLFPMGSILYIPGYGYGIVADTGSAIKGNKIDLYFPTTKQVYKEWGKKDVEVQVIRQGAGKCTEKMLSELADAIDVYKSVPDSWLDKAI